jgi:hypothetical protein
LARLDQRRRLGNGQESQIDCHSNGLEMMGGNFAPASNMSHAGCGSDRLYAR